jgi:hypothetical protein
LKTFSMTGTLVSHWTNYLNFHVFTRKVNYEKTIHFFFRIGRKWVQDGDDGLILRWDGDNNPIKLFKPVDRKSNRNN